VSIPAVAGAGLKEPKMKPKLVVIGAGGRMGKRILSLAVESGEFDIIAAVERQDHPDIDKDAGLVAAAGPINVKLTDMFPAAGDVAIVRHYRPKRPAA